LLRRQELASRAMRPHIMKINVLFGEQFVVRPLQKQMGHYLSVCPAPCRDFRKDGFGSLKRHDR
jgi:hypothetical protein